MDFHHKTDFFVDKIASSVGVLHIPSDIYVAHLIHCASEKLVTIVIVGLVYKQDCYANDIHKTGYRIVAICGSTTSLGRQVSRLPV